MKLYHYSAEPYPVLMTKRLSQPLSEEDIADGEQAADFRGDLHPYFDHISFFFDPIPLDIIAGVFKGFKQDFWVAGNVIYEHVVESSGIKEFDYVITESPMDVQFRKERWTDDVYNNDQLKKRYFQQRKHERLKRRYIGNGTIHLTQAAKEFVGKTRDYFIASPKTNSPEDMELYAASVPHVMLYPEGGQVNIIGSPKRLVIPNSTITLESHKDKKWSEKPTEHAHWHPPEGLFADGSADKIANYLFEHSPDYKTAMSRLSFYIERAGSNLSKEDHGRLNHAKQILKGLHEKQLSLESIQRPPSATWSFPSEFSLESFDIAKAEMKRTMVGFSNETDLSKIPELFHISFEQKLDGVWIPKIPAGMIDKHSSDKSLSEPDVPRISCSSSLHGCFLAVYPNVSKYFEEHNYPYMEFHVYSPDIVTGTKVLTPTALTKHRLVWDAHVTHEYSILNPVRMRHVGVVRYMNPGKVDFIKTHPFNDSDLPLKDVAPKCHYSFKKD